MYFSQCQCVRQMAMFIAISKQKQTFLHTTNYKMGGPHYASFQYPFLSTYCAKFSRKYT